MKVLQRLFLGAAFAVAAISIHAKTTTTTWALGQDLCAAHQVDCYSVPIYDSTGALAGKVWIDLAPYADPTSSRFIDGIPASVENGINGWAGVNLDSTYQVTYTTASYTTADGRHWSGSVPKSISLTFYQIGVDASNNTYTVSNGYTGVAKIILGNYYYVDTCSGRGCGGVLGWHWYVVGGSLQVVRTN